MEPFIGQLQLFAFNFAPQGWAKCDGQILQIASNTALFSLLGTQYGGDGRTTFGLPDLRGRAPIHQGQGPGLSSRPIGARAGVESVVLSVNQLAAHSHVVTASSMNADSLKPGNCLMASSNPPPVYRTEPKQAGDVQMGFGMIEQTGGNQAHDNMPPFLVMNWCIALTGIFPSQP